MFSIIYNNRVIACRYLNPIVGDMVRIGNRNFTIVEVNYYAKAVWVV